MVSVIVPFHNTPIELTRRAFEGVLLQEWPELEVVVVDDGSNPDSHRQLRELVEEFAPRLEVRLLVQPNAGPGAARNRAVAEARYPLIAPLDADDRWLPGKLRLEVETLVGDPELWLVCGGMAVEDTAGTRMKERWGAERVKAFGRGTERLYLSLLLSNSVNHSTVCYRRDGFLELGGYDATLPNAQDWELWLRACRAGFRFRYLDLPMAVQVYHGANISLQASRRRPANRRVLERELSAPPAFLRDLPRTEVAAVLATAWFRVGRLLWNAGAGRSARRAFAASFRERPSLKAAFRWAVTWMPARGPA